METSTYGWIGVGAVVAGWDIFAPKGQTLSEGIDRGLEHSPLRRAAILSGIAVTALHLSNVLPEKYDPFHYALLWKE